MSSSKPSIYRPLEGKLALITGCTGGIGKASALALAKRGCSIAVHYHANASGADELVSVLNSHYFTPRGHKKFQADLSTYDEVRRLHKEVTAEMGSPDVLFNNSGVTTKHIGRDGNIADISIEDFEQTWRTNNGTAFLLTQLCFPHMEKQQWGRIIFCSSVAAGTGGVVGPHYASSKSAMHGMVHWIAQRYAKEGITCNAVAPALIAETNMMSNPSEEIKKLIPVGRFGKPEEIASVVDLLATNAYMTNKIVVADGGWTPSGF